MSDDSGVLSISVKTTSDTKVELSIEASATVASLKEQLVARTEIPASQQRLIYSGKVLKDPDTLAHYKIKSGHTIHLVKGAAKSSTGAASQSSQRAVPSTIAAGTGPDNHLAGLTGARYAGLANLPSMSAFGPNGGMGPPSVENLEALVNSPGFGEMLQGMFSDPDVVLNQVFPGLQQTDPAQYQLVRNVMASPQMQQVISRPEYWEMALERMRSGQMPGAEAFGGMPSTNSFPAPGNPDQPESDSQAPTEGTRAAQPNPFEALLGSNPFAGAGSAGMAQAAAQDPNFWQNLQALAGLGGSQGFPGASAPSVPEDTRPPEERYESQLRQLNELGFYDFDRNVRALRRSGGNVQGAVESMLDGQV